MTHAEAVKQDNIFISACGLAEIPATKRQHSKFTMGKGKAFKFKQEAIDKAIPKTEVSS